MLKFKKLFHTSASLQAAIATSRKYKNIIITWRDRTHEHAEDNKLMNEWVVEHQAELTKHGIVKLMARSPMHPPKEGDPPGTIDHLTLYGIVLVAAKALKGAFVGPAPEPTHAAKAGQAADAEAEEVLMGQERFALHLNKDGTHNMWDVPEEQRNIAPL